MNIAGLEKLIERLESIKDTPQAPQFNMKYFGETWTRLNEFDKQENMGTPVCGAVACLAGEYLLAVGEAKIDNEGYFCAEGDPETLAIRGLELTQEEKERLFFFSSWNSSYNDYYGWPQKFEQRYYDAKNNSERVQVAIDRVRHFIDTNGEE